jgi:hypothetical protein
MVPRLLSTLSRRSSDGFSSAPVTSALLWKPVRAKLRDVLGHATVSNLPDVRAHCSHRSCSARVR